MDKISLIDANKLREWAFYNTINIKGKNYIDWEMLKREINNLAKDRIDILPDPNQSIIDRLDKYT